MRIIVAPDSFKGSISALGAAEAMERGISKVFPTSEVLKLPIADGGEGTVEALIAATSGKMLIKEVQGPLGSSVKAHWGVLGDGCTAVIEMAAASGLPLVPHNRRNPSVTSTYGTGQLIKTAMDEGLSRIIIGIGGSATNDGGAGMARALGVKFFDNKGCELPEGGATLKNLEEIDLSGIDPRLKQTEIFVACDVDNPLCGPHGASYVYGPQKGASPQMVSQLDEALRNYSKIATKVTRRDISDMPGAGAAGGLGAGLLFFTNARLMSGIDVVLMAADYENLVKSCDLVITGEGKTDYQTAYGKAPVGVAKIAKKYNIPVICLSGCLGEKAEDVLEMGIDGLLSIVPGPMALEDCMVNAEKLIEDAAERLCRILAAGAKIGGKLDKQFYIKI